MAKACELAGRNLTGEEWDRYVEGAYAPTCRQWPAGTIGPTPPFEWLYVGALSLILTALARSASAIASSTIRCAARARISTSSM
ncbi:MAG: hypothetical protein H0T40_15035 [Geodermatophilaceae bacterium]|nr:hypothetical protein [Geodermatophilaceae bacterium]